MLHATGILALVFLGVLAASAIWHGGALQWTRFFFRGWVVLSLVWVGTIGAVGWESVVAPVGLAEDPRCLVPTSKECLELKRDVIDRTLKGDHKEPEHTKAPRSVRIERAQHVAAIALLPPIVLLGIGFSCAWVLRGLRTGKPA